MPIVVPGGITNPAAPVTATGADGVVTATLRGDGSGVLLRARFRTGNPVRVRFVRLDGGVRLPVRGGDPVPAVGREAVAFDAEAPLDQAVSWAAIPYTDDGGPVGVPGAESAPVVLQIPALDVSRHDVRLVAVDQPGLAIRLQVAGSPEESRTRGATLQQPRSSRFPVGGYGVRAEQATEHVFRTDTLTEHQQLQGILDAGVMLLQTATVAGRADQYVLGLSDTTRFLVGGWDPARLTTVSVQPTARPVTVDSPLIIPGRSAVTLLAAARTCTEVVQVWPTCADLLT